MSDRIVIIGKCTVEHYKDDVLIHSYEVDSSITNLKALNGQAKEVDVIELGKQLRREIKRGTVKLD